MFQDEMELMGEGTVDKEKLLKILREIRRDNPDASPEELEKLANDRLVRALVLFNIFISQTLNKNQKIQEIHSNFGEISKRLKFRGK